ncbi:hypothetical protein PAEPH01_1066 [Pancytospora epiphaga]|nr:hypothetical protein PAEPH01_1066 [Pancytospora epiphaga]
MGDKKPEHTRKVSFAAEPQINYIYHDDANSTKTSSSVTETHMEFTTDIPEFRRASLFQNPENENLSESLENLFITKNIEEYQEDPILLREYARRRESIGRKMSLDPLKALTLRDIEKNERGTTTSMLENCDNNKKALVETLEEAENEANVSNLSRQEASFNDTAITNSSFVVEELVNTIDLKKLIHPEPEDKKNLSEYLSSLGIRFLDESITDAMRRDTLSKSRNEVDPSLYYHYKYSLKERIEYLYNFSGYLGERMKELQGDIDGIQKDVDVESLSKELLKKIRNVARNNSKIDWYNLRKLNELQFNKTIASNRQKLQELVNNKRKELEGIEAEISVRAERIEMMKKLSEEIHQRLMQAPAAELQEAEKLQKMISERMGVLEAVRRDGMAVSNSLEEASVENKRLEESIAKLKNQNTSLRNNLLIKSMNEGELNEIKKITRRYCSTFGIRILKLTKSSVVLNIYDHTVTLSLDSECRVISSSILAKYSDPVFSLAETPTGICDFAGYVRNLTGRFIFLKALKSEIEQLQERIRIEMFFVNKQLHLRVFPGSNKPFIDLVIGSNFMLSSRGNEIYDIQKMPGGLTVYVNQHAF